MKKAYKYICIVFAFALSSQILFSCTKIKRNVANGYLYLEEILTTLSQSQYYSGNHNYYLSSVREEYSSTHGRILTASDYAQSFAYYNDANAIYFQSLTEFTNSNDYNLISTQHLYGQHLELGGARFTNINKKSRTGALRQEDFKLYKHKYSDFENSLKDVAAQHYFNTIISSFFEKYCPNCNHTLFKDVKFTLKKNIYNAKITLSTQDNNNTYQKYLKFSFDKNNIYFAEYGQTHLNGGKFVDSFRDRLIISYRSNPIILPSDITDYVLLPSI